MECGPTIQIVLLDLIDQNLRLRTRHDRCANPSVVWHAHMRLAISAADVARLAFRVRRAFLDCDRDGLVVFLVGMVCFRTAAALDPSAVVEWPAPQPLLSAVACRGRIVSRRQRQLAQFVRSIAAIWCWLCLLAASVLAGAVQASNAQ